MGYLFFAVVFALAVLWLFPKKTEHQRTQKKKSNRPPKRHRVFPTRHEWARLITVVWKSKAKARHQQRKEELKETNAATKAWRAEQRNKRLARKQNRRPEWHPNSR